MIERLRNGLDSLISANKAVEELKIILVNMQPELQKASEQT